MLQPESSPLVIAHAKSSSYISETDFFLIIEVAETIDVDSIAKKIKEEVSKNPPSSLEEFKQEIVKNLETYNPSDYSLAAMFQNKDIVYLFTQGRGSIYINRENLLNKLVDHDNSASGFVKDGDLFILGLDSFFEKIQTAGLAHVFNQQSPLEITSDLIANMPSHVDHVVLFVRFFEQDDLDDSVPIKVPTSESGMRTPFLEKLRGQVLRHKVSPNKKLTILVAVVLLILFVWSVGFGIQRRAKSELAKKISYHKEIILSKLSDAADVATLNTERSKILVEEAKKGVDMLKKETGNKDIPEVAELENLINEKEKQIFKHEDKQAEEFYNLDLISEKAAGTNMYLDDDQLDIINNGTGDVYIISVSKKSKDSFQNSNLKNTKSISGSEGDIFFLKSDGIYKSTDGKVEKVIKADEWGTAVDFAVFNGNIYVVDSQKQDIYKYLVAEKGYSDKTSYLKSGQKLSSQDITSLAIDGSVYVAGGDTIDKYTTGLEETFNVSLPNSSSPTYTKVITTQDLNKVYLFDKTAGSIYIISKDGQYERQIVSSILKSADDVSISETEHMVLVLVKNKIYKLGLD
jgi:hypothetical protein